MRTIHALASPAVPPLRIRRGPTLTALAARLRAPWLDRQLAAGTAPWSSPTHAARALQLTSPRNRHSLARSLERLVEQSAAPRSPFRGAAIAPCREQVQDALSLVLGIAGCLRSAQPIDARGVARLQSVLCDGGGPGYLRSERHALTSALEAVVETLNAQD